MNQISLILVLVNLREFTSPLFFTPFLIGETMCEVGYKSYGLFILIIVII